MRLDRGNLTELCTWYLSENWQKERSCMEHCLQEV
jgi:hypothetical protein